MPVDGIFFHFMRRRGHAAPANFKKNAPPGCASRHILPVSALKYRLGRAELSQSCAYFIIALTRSVSGGYSAIKMAVTGEEVKSARVLSPIK